MTPLVIFASADRKKFDSPPKFNLEERSLYFSLPHNELSIVNELRSPSTEAAVFVN